MRLRPIPAFSSSILARSVSRLMGRRSSVRERRRKFARLQMVEQLEARQLLALDILSLSPADGAIDVAVDTNLVITFNEDVLRGQGNIHVVDSATGKLGVAVDVTSSSVVISGAVVTIDLPQDLSTQTDFTVFIDPGTFIDTSGTPTADATLLTEGFEFLPLGPAVDEGGGNGSDFTHTPPLNWVVDNSSMPNGGASGGITEWRGWSFARRDFWSQVDNQNRSDFTLGQGTIAVGDPDEYDDAAGGGTFNGAMVSRPVKLDGVAANSVQIEFDSSFRPENSQVGTLEVTFDSGASWTNILTLNPTNTTNLGNVNEVRTISVDNPSSGTMELRWRVTGGNTWWWAIDNLDVTGDIVGVPFDGISDATAWNFSNRRELELTIDPQLMPEVGGTATGTLTRNISVGELVVTLVSSDTTEATVPATVTIPNGQTSVTFPITAVDDVEIDGTQVATITATAATYLPGDATVSVTDDDAFAIISLTPADNSEDFPFSNNLEITFNKDVKAGSGRIYVVQSSTNTLGFVVDVNNAAAVTFSGPTVTINPPGDLLPSTEYYVLVDDGAILDTTTDTFGNTTLLRQTFDVLPLGPFNTETGGDGTDYTKTPPLGFSIPVNPAGGLVEWRGWSFADKNSWIGATGGGNRSNFSLGSGNVAVADPDAWDINNPLATYNTTLQTPAVDLTKIAAGSASLQFDSSFQGLGGPGLADIEVSYNGGATWILLATMSATNSNASVTINSSSSGNNGIVRVWTPLNNPGSGSMAFRFKISNSGEAGYWAIDNIRIAGQVTGRPWEGFADPSQWNFRSSELPTLRIAIDPGSISEDGGTATATVSRSVFNAGDLTVTLTSNDLTEATVPATVVIPDGQFSATFPITAVNDNELDGDQIVTITATAAGLLNIPSTLVVQSADQPVSTVFNPADDSSNVPVGSNFSATFDQNVKKGNGFVHFLRASDNKLGASVDVRSAAVTIDGATVTVDPPADLVALTDYYLVIDDGAILADNTFVRFDALLLSEDFEKLPLGPAAFEVPLNGDGLDWTAIPPTGFSVDNSAMPPGGVPEWTGWTFANKDFWANAGGQSRNSFTRGTGTVAIGDTDEWDDTQRPSNAFNSLFQSPAIDLSNVAANSVTLSFDSSFRPENGGTTNNQTGVVEVSYDGGANWQNLLTLDAATSPGLTNVDEHRVITINNLDTGSMLVRWGVTGTNDYWWAIDNIEVRGDVSGLPFDGVNDPTTWNVTTADANTLGMSVSLAEIPENGGVAVGTVTRNLGTSGDVVVTLTSSDPTRATVPATVTILDGQTSATFNITAIDNTLAGGDRPIEITAAASGFVGGLASTTILDNEVANVTITEIMYNPAGSEPRTEWIEIYNSGSVDADLSDWKFADEDVFSVLKWSEIPSGNVLPAGGLAVVYNNWFGLTTESAFRAEWSVPESALVIGINWSDLANNGTATNEILSFQDASGAELDLVNFAAGAGWPASTEGRSIFLKNVLTSDNNVGANWALSANGESGAVNPTGPIHSTSDHGSPGFIDFVAPGAPTLALANDTGTGGDLITSDATLSITTTEPGGTFEYRLNGGDWVSAPPAAAQGANTIEVRHTDAAGNLGPAGSLAFTFDSIAPTTPTIALDSDTGTAGDLISSVGTYTTTFGEAGGLMEYRLNGGDWVTTAPAPVEGPNVVDARQTDIAGNVSEVGSLSFTLDTIAPAVPTVTLTTDTGTVGDLITSDGAYTVTPAEAGGTVEYRLNGGAWLTSTPAAVEGTNLIESRQTDTAGNIGAVGSLTFTLDTVAPAVPTLTLTTDTAIVGDFITSAGAYTMTPAEAGGTVEYRLNGGAWLTTAPATVEGANLIEARQTDTAGNIGVIGSLSFTLDTIAPTAPAVALDNDTGTAGDLITFDGNYTGTPTEAGGTVEYRLNGGAWTTTEPAAVEGTNLIEVRQTDTAGNVGAIGALTFTLDTVPATVSTVYAASSAWSPAFIDTLDGGGAGAGNGLGFALTAGVSLPWSNVDRLYVQFSEAVSDISTATVELRDSVGTVPFTVSFDPVTFIATLDFATEFSFSKLRLAASDALEDQAGNALDGDAAGGAGGLFNFRFDVVPGDSDGNGRVNGADLTLFSNSFNAQAGAANFQARANWNGDNRVNGADLAVFSANFNRNVNSLQEPGAPFVGGSGGVSTFRGGADAFFADLGDEDDDKKEDDDDHIVTPIVDGLGRGLSRGRGR